MFSENVKMTCVIRPDCPACQVTGYQTNSDEQLSGLGRAKVRISVTPDGKQETTLLGKQTSGDALFLCVFIFIF